MTNPATPADNQELITMFAGEAQFGVSVLRVRDVLSAPVIYPAPLAPASVLGSINLRGRIVTAIDLRTRLGLAPREDDAAGKCVIVESAAGEPYALLVDEIGDVSALPANLYEPNPITLSKHWAQVCRGLYREQDGMLIVIDIDALLDLQAAA